MADRRIYVDSEEEFDDMMDALTRHPMFSFDMVLDRGRVPICLIQVGLRDGTSYLIDTLCRCQYTDEKITTEFLPLLRNESFLKILHGANNDVKWLQEQYGEETTIKNAIDIQIFHSLLLGTDPTIENKSLTHLADVYLNRTFVDNKYRNSNWRDRPLLPKMLDYAAYDVQLLLRVYNVMFRMMVDDGRPALYDQARTLTLKYVLQRDGQIDLPEWKRDVAGLEFSSPSKLRQSVSTDDDDSPKSRPSTPPLPPQEDCQSELDPASCVTPVRPAHSSKSKSRISKNSALKNMYFQIVGVSILVCMLSAFLAKLYL